MQDTRYLSARAGSLALADRSMRELTDATNNPTRMPTSNEPADGIRLPSGKERDPTGFMVRGRGEVERKEYGEKTREGGHPLVGRTRVTCSPRRGVIGLHRIVQLHTGSQSLCKIAERCYRVGESRCTDVIARAHGTCSLFASLPPNSFIP